MEAPKSWHINPKPRMKGQIHNLPESQENWKGKMEAKQRHEFVVCQVFVSIYIYMYVIIHMYVYIYASMYSR